MALGFFVLMCQIPYPVVDFHIGHQFPYSVIDFPIALLPIASAVSKRLRVCVRRGGFDGERISFDLSGEPAESPGPLDGRPAHDQRHSGRHHQRYVIAYTFNYKCNTMQLKCNNH